MFDLKSQVTDLSKDKTFEAEVLDVLGDKVAVRISNNGQKLFGVRYYGGQAVVGDKVMVDYSTGQPKVYSTYQSEEPPRTVRVERVTTSMGGGGGGGGVTDHGALTGLSDDDHPQYLLASGTRDLAGDWTVSGTYKIEFYDSNVFIRAALSQYLQLYATGDIRLQTPSVVIGVPVDGVDYVLKFDGTDSDCTFTWMEDEALLTIDAEAGVYIRSTEYGQLFVESFDSGNKSPFIVMVRSDSDSLGTYTETDSGETLGYYGWQGSNSSSARNWGAAIRAIQTGAAGATYVPAEIVFEVSDGSSNIAERGRFTQEGFQLAAIGGDGIDTNIIITGTSGPYGVSEVLFQQDSVSGDYPALYLDVRTADTSESDRGAGFMFTDGDGTIQFLFASYPALNNTYIDMRQSGDVIFRDSSLNPTLVIDSNGWVGIGTPDPKTHFEVASSADYTGIFASTYSDSAEFPLIGFLKSDTDTIGTYSQTDSGDILGQLGWYGIDSSSSAAGACWIQGKQEGAAASSYVPGQLIFGTGTSTAVPTAHLYIMSDGTIKFADGRNLEVGTSTGTQIGTSTSQKVSLFGATPVTQRSHISDPAANVTALKTAVDAILVILEDMGIMATS